LDVRRGREPSSAHYTAEGIQLRLAPQENNIGIAIEDWTLFRDGKQLFIKRRLGFSIQILAFNRSSKGLD
jgi:hypothetical protein